MNLDDELCLCFHVTKRKVLNFLRVEKPRRAGQLSECFGAGTGCGWCRPFLQKLFDAASSAAAGQEAAAGQDGPSEVSTKALVQEPTAAEYAKQRSQYVKSGGGTPPPGATPVDDH